MRTSLGLTGLAATALLLLGSIGFVAGAQPIKPADRSMATATAVF